MAYIKRIHLKNFLSFGPQSEAIELGPLNVLIGPNGTGKSNFVEALSLLGRLPSDPAALIREGGGMDQWIWKGVDAGQSASVDVVVQLRDTDEINASLRHSIELVPERPQHPRPFFLSEVVENERIRDGEDTAYFYFKNTPSHPPTINIYDQDRKRRVLNRDIDINFNESVVSQFKDPSTMRELGALSDLYKDIVIYKDWSFGRQALGRQLQRADLPVERMLPDASNFALFLNYLRGKSGVKRRLLDVMSNFYDGFDDFGVDVFSNTVQLYFEEGDVKTPAVRLSDGTMRFMFLTAILLDPTPPPVICIEEPELGLHPDSIVMLAKLLIEASERTQLIVTTHSDVLIDALSARPDAILVCERYQEGTFLRRLDADALSDFLQDYSLGSLWRSGHIGGNRW